MITVIKLKALTLTSKKAAKEIKEILPEATSKSKAHVAGIGYVLYIENKAGECIAHAFKDREGLILEVK